MSCDGKDSFQADSWFWLGGLILLSVFLGLLTPAPVSCQQASIEEQRRPLVIGLCRILGSIDPHMEHSLATESLFASVYEKLIEFNVDGNPVPGLATGWSWKTDSLLRLELRPDVKFHDGRDLTAEDVIHSLFRARDYPNGLLGTRLRKVADVRSPSAGIIEIETRTPDPLLPRQLAFIGIVPKDSPARIESLIGSGPYRWVEYRPNESVTLEYVGGQGPEVPDFLEVEYRFFSTTEECTKELLAHRIDITPIPRSRFEEIEADPSLWVHSRISPGASYIQLNTKKPPFNSRALRGAVGRVIDRDALVSAAFAGLARPASQLAAPSSDGYSEEIELKPRDTAEARQLIAALAPELRSFELSYSEGAHILGQELIRQFRELGFEVRARELPLQELYGLGEDFAMAIKTWMNNIHDLGDVLTYLLRCPDPDKGSGSRNTAGYCNPELDAEIDLAGRSLDPELRNAAIKRASQIVLDQAPLIPLVWTMYTYGADADIEWEPRSDHRIHPGEVRWRP